MPAKRTPPSPWPRWFAFALTSPWCPLSWFGEWYFGIRAKATELRMIEVLGADPMEFRSEIRWWHVLPFGWEIRRALWAEEVRAESEAIRTAWIPEEPSSPDQVPR